MQLLRKFISNDLSELHNNNVRIRVIGSRAEIPRDIVDLIKGAETLTVNNTGLYLQIAFNYSGRQEIINATKKIAIASSKGEIDPNKINNTIFENNLYSAGVPDPDLIIRTGSEKRISKDVKKTISSAVANAENNLGLDIDDLKVSQVYVNEAPTFKRFRARARGRGTRILKRNSHITIELSDE